MLHDSCTPFVGIIKYHCFFLYKLQCLKCSAEFTKPANSDDLLCPDCGSSMTVLVSSPGQDKPVIIVGHEPDKPVFAVGHAGYFLGEHDGAANLNTSSIKTLNGNMSVTALMNLSTSSSSSSYLEAVDQTQETGKTDSAYLSNKNILPAEDKEYVFFSLKISLYLKCLKKNLPRLVFKDK